MSEHLTELELAAAHLAKEEEAVQQAERATEERAGRRKAVYALGQTLDFIELPSMSELRTAHPSVFYCRVHGHLFQVYTNKNPSEVFLVTREESENKKEITRRIRTLRDMAPSAEILLEINGKSV